MAWNQENGLHNNLYIRCLSHLLVPNKEEKLQIYMYMFYRCSSRTWLCKTEIKFDS